MDGYVAGAPVYEKTIPAPDENNRHYISRPHLQVLLGFYLPLKTLPENAR